MRRNPPAWKHGSCTQCRYQSAVEPAWIIRQPRFPSNFRPEVRKTGSMIHSAGSLAGVIRSEGQDALPSSGPTRRVVLRVPAARFILTLPPEGPPRKNGQPRDSVGRAIKSPLGGGGVWDDWVLPPEAGKLEPARLRRWTPAGRPAADRWSVRSCREFRRSLRRWLGGSLPRGRLEPASRSARR